jgi:endonuclease III
MKALARNAKAAAGAGKAETAKKTAGKKPVAKKPAAKRAKRAKKPVLMTDAQIEEFFARLAAKTPEPETELQFTNVYTLLVAVALSAQATDIGVNKATGPLFAVVETPEQMVELGEEGLKQYIRTVGLFNSKAKHVIALSEKLIAEHGSEVPRSREDLEALPGVGRKTANVVLNNYWGEPTIAVDTHLFRVSNRLGMAPGKTPLAVELGLEARIPNHWKRHAHHWLILHGRYTCKARKPECVKCPVADLCQFDEKVVG